MEPLTSFQGTAVRMAAWKSINPPFLSSSAFLLPPPSPAQTPSSTPTQSRINCDRLRTSLCRSLPRLPAWSNSRSNLRDARKQKVAAACLSAQREDGSSFFRATQLSRARIYTAGDDRVTKFAGRPLRRVNVLLRANDCALSHASHINENSTVSA